MKLKFGDRNVIEFNTEDEFFLCLGYLVSPNRKIKVALENYKKKWGEEWRIYISEGHNAPKVLKDSFSKGTFGYEFRLNCNEYVECLIKDFGLELGSNQDNPKIFKKIPHDKLACFEQGLAL